MFDANNFDNSYNGDTINTSNQWFYPLQYLWESDQARRTYGCLLHRVKKAMLGKPSRNLYQEELSSNIDKISDQKIKESYQRACISVPEGESFAIRNAVKTRANQMSGGVDTYECELDDKYGIIDDDTSALIEATCKQDYVRNHLNRFAEVFSRDLTEAGISAALVKYCPKTHQNKVLRINPKNIWFDTKYSATGEERFRGYSTMISWRTVKEMVKSDGDDVNLTIKAPDRSLFSDGVLDLNAKVGTRKIRSLNGLDIYVESMNQLATSTQLQGNWASTFVEYEHDLRSVYNLNYYHSLATDAKARTNNGYYGDDVELTILYDLVNKIEFKILNRRYVISANSAAFKRPIVFTYYDDRNNGAEVRTIDDYELECPLIFGREEVENMDAFPYPTSTLMALLDSFDILCALRAKRKHVSDILSILRIETNAADAASLRGLLNIMGIVLDDIQGEINTIQFNYDYTHLDSQIEYYESLIKKSLDAYDEFDALQAMGDRASAAESGMALSAVAQGLASHQNAIMNMYADIARLCVGNRVMYSDKQEFPIYNRGHYDLVTIQQMALVSTVSVVSKLAKRIQDRFTSSQALSLLGTLGGNLNEDGVAAFIEMAMAGTVPRRMARSFIKEAGASQEEIALAQQQAQNMAQALDQNQQMYLQSPEKYEVQNVMDNYSPEQIESLINTMAQDQGLNSLSELDGQTQDITTSPEMAGEIFDQSNAEDYVEAPVI